MSHYLHVDEDGNEEIRYDPVDETTPGLRAVPDAPEDDEDTDDDQDWTDDEDDHDGLMVTMVDAEAYEDNDMSRGLMMLDMLGDQVFALADVQGEFALWHDQWWHRYTAEQMYTAAWMSTVPVAMREAAIRYQAQADEARAQGEDPEALEKMSRAFESRAVKAGNELQMSKGVACAWGAAVTPPSGRQARRRRSWDFDADSALLGANNGIIDIGAYCASGDTDDLLRPARREDMVTESIGYDFDPAACSQIVADHLELFMSASDELRRDTFMVLGDLTMVGNGRRIMPFLKGVTSTGKSATAELTEKSLGNYAGTVEATEIFRVKTGPRPELTTALPKRAVLMSEVGAHAVLHSDMVKGLTSQDTRAARALYSNKITKEAPRFTPLIATNKIPQITGADDDGGAVFKRLIVIPFDQSHPTLGARIAYDDEARSHWLRLMIEGRRDSYQWAKEHGHDWTGAMHLCAEIVEATKDAVGDLDPFRVWAEEMFDVSPTATYQDQVSTAQALQLWQAAVFAETVDKRLWTVKEGEFSKRMKAMYGGRMKTSRKVVAPSGRTVDRYFYNTPIVLRDNTESE